MAQVSPTARTPIHVMEDDGDRPVVLVASNEDRFVVTCRDAILVAELGISRKVFFEELRELFRHAQKRIASLDRVHAAYAAPRDGQVVIFVVPVSETMDFELSDRLTELDLELAEKFQVCRCDVIQIPKSAVETFVDASVATVLYGSEPRSSEEVDA